MSKLPEDRQDSPETRRMDDDPKPTDAGAKKKPARGRSKTSGGPPAEAHATIPAPPTSDMVASDAVNDDTLEIFDPEATITLSAEQLDAHIAESAAIPSERVAAASEVDVESSPDATGESETEEVLHDTQPPVTRPLGDDELAAQDALADADDSDEIVDVAPNAGAGDVSRDHLKGLLEALIFASDKPLRAIDIARSASAPVKEVRVLLEVLKGEYVKRGIHLDEVAGGWIFRTSATYAPFVRDMATQKPVRLSRAQVETLAILAYRQPITRPEIDDIRGVDCGAVLKLLLERDLVRILGKKDEPGRPILYGTSHQFLEFFGLKSLRDLPTLREFTDLNEDSRRTVEQELGEVLDSAQARLTDDPAVRASTPIRTAEELATLETDESAERAQHAEVSESESENAPEEAADESEDEHEDEEKPEEKPE